MSNEIKVYTESGKIYYINERGGYYYVTKPSWMPLTDSVGSANTVEEAAMLIVSDAGEKITSFE